MTNPDPTRYISVQEAARLLDIAEATAYLLAYRGQVPAKRIGNRLWLERPAVEARHAKLSHLRSGDCLSIDEVAEFFGVHSQTVRLWYAKRLLPAEKIAQRLCFDLASVIAFEPPAGRPSARAPTRTIRGTFYPKRSNPPTQ